MSGSPPKPQNFEYTVFELLKELVQKVDHLQETVDKNAQVLSSIQKQRRTNNAPFGIAATVGKNNLVKYGVGIQRSQKRENFTEEEVKVQKKRRKNDDDDDDNINSQKARVIINKF